MKPYTITPGVIHARDAMPLLRFTEGATLAEIQRGTALARALGGRYARGLIAFHLFPSAARKFCVLFDAGFEAHRRIIRGVSIWEFSLAGGASQPRSVALRMAKGVAV